jgi:hypothetical protein
LDPLNSFEFFGTAGSFQLAGLNEADRNPSLSVIYLKHDLKHDLKHRPETGAASAQGAYDARLSSRRTASVVIRVWTLCIIRSVPEQRQTVVAALVSSMLAIGQPFCLQLSAVSSQLGALLYRS